ncbi:helix-turn-helix domain-containing protein [Inhella inkyongensis]|nr:AraC family transcriptional regulator [Inhella inkyongensis]
MPDLPPRPATAANAAYRRSFYARWGRENVVVLGRTRFAEYVPIRHRLSVKRSWGGPEDYLLESRRLTVDEDQLLILNEGATYGSRIASRLQVLSMGVFFRPGLAPEMQAALRQSTAQWLDRGPLAESGPQPGFAENIRPVQGAVGRRLDAMRAAIEAGEDDELWLEEQMQALLAAMWQDETQWRARSQALHGMSASQHAELLRRVDAATDCLHSRYTESLTLDDLAQAARLSKFHLLRAFQRVHGQTPHQMLTQQRVQAARRLMDATELSLDEVARMSGLGTRQTLWRQLRKPAGLTKTP